MMSDGIRASFGRAHDDVRNEPADGRMASELIRRSHRVLVRAQAPHLVLSSHGVGPVHAPPLGLVLPPRRPQP